LLQLDPGKSLSTQLLQGIGLVACYYGSFLIMIFIFFTGGICAKLEHGHDRILQQFGGFMRAFAMNYICERADVFRGVLRKK